MGLMFSIDVIGTRELGRCYNETTYKVWSRYQVSRSDLMKLREIGLLGYGQEFQIESVCDGTEKSNEDRCYEYICISRVDSGD